MIMMMAKMRKVRFVYKRRMILYMSLVMLQKKASSSITPENAYFLLMFNNLTEPFKMKIYSLEPSSEIVLISEPESQRIYETSCRKEILDDTALWIRDKECWQRHSRWFLVHHQLMSCALDIDAIEY